MSTSLDRALGGKSADLRELLERVGRAWEGLDGRLAASGGVAHMLELYEQMRAGLQRVGFEELDRTATEVKSAVDVLLALDSDLRKLNNLKLLFESASRGSDERQEDE